MTEQARRVAGGAGVVFVVLTLIGGFIPGQPPAFDEPIEKITNFFVDKSSQIVSGAFVQALGVAIGLVFFTGLWRVLRRAQGDDSWDGATVFYAAAVAATAVIIVGTAANAVPSFEAEQFGTPSSLIVRLSSDLSGVTFTLLSALLFVSIGSAGLTILRTGALPAWLGWLSILAAGSNVAAALGIVRSALYKAGLFTGFLPTMVFVLVTSVMLLTTKERPPATS